MKHHLSPQLQLLNQRIKAFVRACAFFLLVLPASNNYEIHDFAFGSGGVGNADSTSYSLNAVSGETGSGPLESTTYRLGAGLAYERQANTPAAPTLSNPASYYNKLLVQLATGDNPTDAVYAIAISSDNWVTTRYVQSDNTVGSTLGIEDYQTYTNWGAATGELIVGLTPNTTYLIKVKAMHGKFTESDYSVEASAATSQVSLTYDIDIGSTDIESSSPYVIAFGSLTPGSVSTATNRIWFDLASNAENGAFVYVRGQNNGLRSATQAYTIPAVSADLTGQSEGFGIRVASTAQTSGGPLAAVSPFVGAGETVGALTTTSQTIIDSSSQPIVAGRASVLVKAKVSSTTPAAADYADVITAVASAGF